MTRYRKLSDVTAEYLCPGNTVEGFRQIEAFAVPFRAKARKFEIYSTSIAIIGATLLGLALLQYIAKQSINQAEIALGLIFVFLGGLGDRTHKLVQETLKIRPNYAAHLPEKVEELLNALCAHDLCARLSISKGAGAENDDQAEDGRPLGRSLPGETFRHRYAPLLLLPDTTLYRHALFSLKFFFCGPSGPIYVAHKGATGGLQPLIDRFSTDLDTFSQTTATHTQNMALLVQVTDRTVQIAERSERVVERHEQAAVEQARDTDRIIQNTERSERITERNEQTADKLAITSEELAEIKNSAKSPLKKLREWTRPPETKSKNVEPEHKWLVEGADAQFEIGLKALIVGEFNSNDEKIPIYEMVFWIARHELKKGGKRPAPTLARRQILKQIEDTYGLEITIDEGQTVAKPRISDSTIKDWLSGWRGKTDIKRYFLENHN